MGATRLASGHFSAVSSRVIGKKFHLLLSIVCIFPFNYPDARRVAPISACVFCSAFQATYNATKTVALLMPILNTLPVRAKALLQCALDFYRTAIIWFIGYGAKLRTSFLFGNQIGTKHSMNHSHKHFHLIQTITVR